MYVIFLASHGSCAYKSENRMLTISYHYSAAGTSQFGNGNVTITLVCGVSIVSFLFLTKSSMKMYMYCIHVS